MTGSAPGISVAGRTDAGVHARGQVASLSHAGEPVRLMRSLNGVLPADVAVRDAAQAPDGFDARRDARSRTYCYRLLTRSFPSPFERGRSLWWPHPVDDDALGECVRLLRGTHDFTAFTPTRTDHVRFERNVLDARWTRAEQVLELWIEADSFMRHMMRVLVGTMLEVAGGRRTPAEFARLLEGAPRSTAAETAEPHGLYLVSVAY